MTMAAKCAFVLYGALLFVGSGNAQCVQNVTIGGGGICGVQLNTSIVPTCFTCLNVNRQPTVPPVEFKLNGMVLPMNAVIMTVEHQLIVSNFTGISLVDGVQNTLECSDLMASFSSITVATLNPIQLQLRPQPSEFYVENSRLRFICLNRNIGILIGRTFWFNHIGVTVGNGGVLPFPEVSRSDAGLFTCGVMLNDKTTTVEIPTVSFNLVVHYPPDVSTNRAMEVFDVGSRLTLTCTFDGIPAPTVAWKRNQVDVSSNTDSITITTSRMTSGTSVLEWENVPMDAGGSFTCIATNSLGSSSTSIAVQILRATTAPVFTTSEPTAAPTTPTPQPTAAPTTPTPQPTAAPTTPTPPFICPTAETTPPSDSTLVEGRGYIKFLTLDDDDGGVKGFVESDKRGSAEIMIKNGIPIGSTSKLVTSLYVLQDGAIIFDKLVRVRSVSSFPLSSNKDIRIVALFFARHDLRQGGSISYKVYNTRSNNMNIVSCYVRHNRGSSNFEGTWMVVAEWRDVHRISNSGDSEFITNTYQLAIISDNTETHAVFIYNCDTLKWSEVAREYAAIGYSLGQSISSSNLANFYNYELSKKDSVKNIACLNNGRRGNIPWSTRVYKIGETVTPENLARSRCIKQLSAEKEEFGIIKPSARRDCPCTFFQLRFNRNFFFVGSFGFNWCFTRRSLLRRRTIRSEHRCCYSIFHGSLVNRDSQGFGSFPYITSSSINFQDNSALAASCCGEVGLCYVFYEQRPPSNCRNYRIPWFAWFFGDPHIRTLDGASYTFNGWGEYTMIQSDNFTLQGRTVAVNASSSGSATVFSAFAFGIFDAVVEISIQEGTSLQLLLNGVDITSSIPDVNDTNIDSELVSFERTSANAIVASFSNDISITVTLSLGSLSSVNGIPSEFQGTFSGLLGNFNSDSTDDFVYQNGTMLDGNATDSMIHFFGQSWQVNDTTSLFTYSSGSTFANFSFPNHIPAFKDEIIAAASPDVLAACGQDSVCIFDAVQTGNISMGLNSMEISTVNIRDEVASANFPPEINGPEKFEIILNQESIFIININDTNLASFSIINGEVQGGTLTKDVSDPSRYIFTWTPAAEVSKSIIFLAIDEGNASTSFEPSIEICPCRNNGTCTEAGLLDLTANPLLLNCICPSAWEGSTCEMDTDSCKEFACFTGVLCVDNKAPLEGATCGNCPEGFSGNGTECEDINECLVPGNCQQDCNNQPGSFECACRDGFEMVNSTHCRDVDECLIVGQCHQVCNNSEGSFVCSCNEGFQILPNNITCEVMPEFACDNETTNCTQLCVQDVQLNRDNCSCFSGFQLDTDGVSCDDVDECAGARSPCEQNCTNLFGSFNCSCGDGYTSEGTKCNDIDECLQSALSESPVCSFSMICNNIPGTFMCSCPDGTFNDNGVCMENTAETTTTVTTIVSDVTDVTTALPVAIQQNTIVVILQIFTVETFTKADQNRLKNLFVVAINIYCSRDDNGQCVFISLVKRNTLLTAADIIITDIVPAGDGIKFYVFVRGVGGDSVLEQQQLLTALIAYSSALQDAGFMATFGVLVEVTTQTPPGSTRKLYKEQLIGIILVALVAAILIIIIIVICMIYCCCSKKRSRKVVLNTAKTCSKTKTIKSQEIEGRENEFYKNSHFEKADLPMQTGQLKLVESHSDNAVAIHLFEIDNHVEIEEGCGNLEESTVTVNKCGDPPLTVMTTTFTEDAEGVAD